MHCNSGSYAAEREGSLCGQLKEIFLAQSAELARRRAKQLAERYEKWFAKAIEILEKGLENSPAFYGFPELDAHCSGSQN